MGLVSLVYLLHAFYRVALSLTSYVSAMGTDKILCRIEWIWGQKVYLKVNMMALDCLWANLVSGTKQDGSQEQHQ